jgi:hypothetical protein
MPAAAFDVVVSAAPSEVVAGEVFVPVGVVVVPVSVPVPVPVSVALPGGVAGWDK